MNYYTRAPVLHSPTTPPLTLRHNVAGKMSEGRSKYVEPLFLCVTRGDLRYLIDLLTQDPESVNATEETGQTLLHYACALGQVEIVIYLLNRQDCSISEQDSIYGHTPLHMACMYNQQRVVAELLKKLAADTDRVCIQDKYGWTALHHAARNGHVAICKLLVANDCRSHIPNMLGKTACHYAAEHGHLDVLKYLYDYVEKRVSPPILSESTIPPTCPTLLHCAATHNHSDVVEWLQHRAYPSNTRCRRILDLDGRKTRDEYAEDVAACRGYPALRGALASYRMLFEGWIKDIQADQVPLDRIKLCICGHARVGKSAMRESLGKPYLQQVFGLTGNVEVTSEQNTQRHTFGIDIRMMHLSGKDIFSVWDFAGQVDSFITHDFFISTQSTAFTVIIKLTSPIEVQRSELLWWLGFIKTKNLGQMPFASSPTEQDRVPMSMISKPRRRLLSVKQRPIRRKRNVSPFPVSTHEQNGMTSEGGVAGQPEAPEQAETEREGAQRGEREFASSPVAMYGSYLQPVPVIIVGSHYDQLEVDQQREAVQRTQALVDELRGQFEEYLDISPKLYPLNCLRAVSPEIRSLKERLCAVRSQLVDLQPLYPRVMEKIARQIESLRAEQPQLKVLSWDKLKEMVQAENQLLSEKQLSYICKCLTNTGVIVYFEEGALSNHIIIDPAWLCKDVLGQALAPGNFPKASLTRVGSHRIPKETVQQQLSQFLERNHIGIIIQLLQNFDLCHHDKENDELCFPAFLTEPLDPNLWKPDTIFEGYTGRRLVCSDITDTFPPGFFSRLQVQILNSLRAEKVYLFKGSVLIDGNNYQCLVEILTPTSVTPSPSKQSRITYSSAITLKGRAVKSHIFNCSQLLDLVQTMIAQLVRVACPTIFLDLQVLSSSDLKAHAPDPYCYTIYEVISAESRNQEVVNSVTGAKDNPVDLLYFGDKSLQRTSGGRNTKVAYLSEDIVQRIEELLVDGDKDWRDLARKLGLDKYIQLLESRIPNSTRLLLLKWGEKPKWTVDSLLFALKDIGRLDVANFIRAHMNLPKK